MKLDKQEIAAIGVIGFVFIAIIVYGVAAFGGKGDKDKRDEFKAPELVKNSVKEDYQQRINKQLREKPRKPKDPVLLNPFEITHKNEKDSAASKEVEELVFPENSEPKPEPETQAQPIRVKRTRVQPKRVVEEPKAVVKEQQPVEVIKEQPVLITKQRYNQSNTNNSININKTFQASVYGEQKIYNGSLLKIRLLTPITLPSGITIPRNTFISGVVAFSKERVRITVKSIPYNNVIHPVNYKVYDANDGLEGIYVNAGGLNDINDKASSEVVDDVVAVPNVKIFRGVGQEVKKWTKKKAVTILDEHKLFIK